MKRKISKIPKIIEKDIKNNKISLITQNLSRIKKDCIFVCIKGKNFNTNNNIKEAFLNGAKYVLGNIDFNSKNYFKIANSRKILSSMLNMFYNFPDTKTDIIGVVGTNGKTSTTYIFRQLCKALNIKNAVIGTNGIYINDDYFESELTTPDSEELFYYLDKAVKNNCEYVIMEVSAHSIKLDKVFSIKFSRIIFTNFSQDHLDFFKTMEKYQKTKESIFYQYNYDKAIINIDDKVGKKIYTAIDKKVSYGKDGDIKLIDYKLYSDYSNIVIYNNKIEKFCLPLNCEYNIYNYLAVFSCFVSLGYDDLQLMKSTQKISSLKGRFQVINISKTHTIIIDYAHTPLSTKKTMEMVKKYYPNYYTITLFGCPGNREQEKRSIIGRIVSKLSDFVIITSDNPNTENPIKIISQIKKGVKGKHLVIENRSEALKKSIEIFLNKSSSVLVVLGKGIEKYQIINSIKIPYNDEEEIKKILENKL